MTATAPRPVGPRPVLADGLTVAAGSSTLLRGPSIYIGLLTLALAGPAVVAQLWVLSWSGSVDLLSAAQVEVANEMIGLAALLVGVAILGLLAVTIEGGAIGTMLIAGRVMGRPVTLRLALERSRRVFWRLVRATLVIGLIEVLVSLAWRAATNAPPVVDDLPNVGVEPIPGAIASMPFIFASVAIVLADDGVRAALRRSLRLVGGHLPLGVALAAFALLSGVLEGLALGSGLDLVLRLTDSLRLDVATGGAGFVAAMAIGLAVAAAIGSLVFTVAAIVTAPQIVAWERLGLPTTGLPGTVEPAADTPATAGQEVPAHEVRGQEVPEQGDAGLDQPEVTPNGTHLDPPPAGPSGVPAGIPAAVATRPRPFRWVTIPMRAAIAALWLAVVAMLIGGPPV